MEPYQQAPLRNTYVIARLAPGVTRSRGALKPCRTHHESGRTRVGIHGCGYESVSTPNAKRVTQGSGTPDLRCPSFASAEKS